MKRIICEKREAMADIEPADGFIQRSDFHGEHAGLFREGLHTQKHMEQQVLADAAASVS